MPDEFDRVMAASLSDNELMIVRDAVAAITQHAATPPRKIPRHVAEQHLAFWPRAYLLAGRPQLRQWALARFLVGPPTARYGREFTPAQAGFCTACTLPATEHVDPAGGETEWLHDVEPDEPHPVEPRPAASPASLSQANPVSR